MPASPETVQHFAAEDISRGTSLSTVRGRLAAVGYFHRRDDHPDPTAGPEITNMMEHFARHFGTPAEPKGALLREDIAGMVRALPGAKGSDPPPGTTAGSPEALHLRGIRDRALILVGFAGALRRSELAGMNVERVTFNPDGFEILIPRSKGDQEGRGQTVGVTRGDAGDLCPRRALTRWIDAAGMERGPIFRAVSHSGAVAPDTEAEPLSGQAVANVIKRAAQAAGLNPETYSGHSLRRGHLTTAAKAGASLSELQRHARHKDPRTTAEYIEDANRMETTTSRHLGL